jgi:hypothetical protein
MNCNILHTAHQVPRTSKTTRGGAYVAKKKVSGVKTFTDFLKQHINKNSDFFEDIS